jgi:cardiolipin-specific phospholipase
MGINGEYYLAGHSLGGYLATVFALKYPQNIKKLLLLSPVGIPEKPVAFTPEEVAKRFNSWPRQQLVKVVLFLWNKNVTPFGALRKLGPLGSKALVRGFVNKRMHMVPLEE